jgi:hypothetical protein
MGSVAKKDYSGGPRRYSDAREGWEGEPDAREREGESNEREREGEEWGKGKERQRERKRWR